MYRSPKGRDQEQSYDSNPVDVPAKIEIHHIPFNLQLRSNHFLGPHWPV